MAKHKAAARTHPHARIGRDQLARWRGQLHQPATMPGQGKRDRQRRPELAELARMMRERVGLAPAPVPVPLHKMGQRDDNDTTERTP